MVNFNKVLNKDLENIIGMMVQIMKVNGIKDKYMEKEFIDGLTEVNMRVNFLKVWDKVLAEWLILKKNIMKVIFIKIKKKDKEYYNIKKVKYIKDNLIIINLMEKVKWFILMAQL